MILKYLWLKLIDYCETVNCEPKDDIDRMLQAHNEHEKARRWAEFYHDHPMSSCMKE